MWISSNPVCVCVRACVRVCVCACAYLCRVNVPLPCLKTSIFFHIVMCIAIVILCDFSWNWCVCICIEDKTNIKGISDEPFAQNLSVTINLTFGSLKLIIHGATFWAVWLNFFEQWYLGIFPLRMGNTFLSGYFRSVVRPVSHLVACWRQH